MKWKWKGVKINQVEELTSPDAEEKRDIKEGIPSDDDLWEVIERRAIWPSDHGSY